MAKRGQPTLYKDQYAEQARKLCELGATDDDLAEFFGVASRTIYRWQAKHEKFCQALKAGKVPADDRVERSLYHKAVGYSFDAVKIFMPAGADAPVYAPYKEHVPPDTTAGIFWLKNRRPELWRDRHQHEVGKPGEFSELSDAERDQEISRLVKRSGTPPARRTTH